MGSRSSSRTSSTQNTTDVTTTSADNRVAQGDGHIGGNISLGQSSGNVTISQTDYGALDNAADIAKSSLDTVTDTVSTASELGEAAISANADLAYESIRAQSATVDASIKAVLDSNRMSDQVVLQALDYNQALIGETNRSEGATTANLLIEKITPLAMIGGGLFILMRVFK